MNDENKVIVDSNGCPIVKESIFNRSKQFILEYYKVLMVLIGLINALISKCVTFNFKRSCQKYYNVDIQYFDGKQRLEDANLLLILAMILFLYPIILFIINKKTNDKKNEKLFFVFCIGIFFYQSITYNEYVMFCSSCSLIRTIASSWIAIIVLLVADIIVSYYFVWGFKKHNPKLIDVLGVISFIIFIINISWGIGIGLTYGIENKKTYEIIDDGNGAIVSTYDGKFVVMDCEIYGKNEYLYLEKGNYHLEEMINHNIEYIEFKEVRFEEQE